MHSAKSAQLNHVFHFILCCNEQYDLIDCKNIINVCVQHTAKALNNINGNTNNVTFFL